MPTELPDFVRGILLLGQDAAGDPVAVIVDANGQIQVLLRGQDGSGDPQTVKVDSDGQLFTILRGAAGVDVSVDAAGFLSAILKGIDGTATLRTVATDASGQIIMVPRGQAGNYMAVDASGFLSAILKGTDGGSVVRDVAVDTSGQMIMVPRGSSGNYMLVDSDGYLTAVLKGVQGSTLTTISVDANGRLEAFALDAEDQWGDTLKTGNSELAARLGSPVAYDWRGQVLTYNTFENGRENLYPILYGAGASVAIDVDYALTGGYCLKMLGGSDGTMKATVQGIVGRNPSSRIGVTVAFSPVLNPDYFTVFLRVRDQSTRYIGGLKYDPGGYDLYYYDENAAWQRIGAYYHVPYPYAYSFMKLVIDIDTGDYVRALFQGSEVDLSAYALDTDASGYNDSVEVLIEVVSTSGNNHGFRFDHYVITVNEP